MTTEHPTVMATFRLEAVHRDTVDRLARADGISRTDWFRRATMAQIVVELSTEDKIAKAYADLQNDRAGDRLLEEAMGDRPPMDTAPVCTCGGKDALVHSFDGSACIGHNGEEMT